jgi:hypothetical protein
MHPVAIFKILKTDMLMSPLKHVTHHRIHVLPLLNRRGWKKLVFRNVCVYMQNVLRGVTERIL